MRYKHFAAFFRRKHFFFQWIVTDGHDQPIVELRGPLDDIEVPMRDGVEHARKNRRVFHGPRMIIDSAGSFEPPRRTC